MVEISGIKQVGGVVEVRRRSTPPLFLRQRGERHGRWLAPGDGDGGGGVGWVLNATDAFLRFS